MDYPRDERHVVYCPKNMSKKREKEHFPFAPMRKRYCGFLIKRIPKGTHSFEQAATCSREQTREYQMHVRGDHESQN